MTWIWDQKPPLLINAGTLEVGVNPEFISWLEIIKIIYQSLADTVIEQDRIISEFKEDREV